MEYVLSKWFSRDIAHLMEENEIWNNLVPVFILYLAVKSMHIKNK